MSSTINSTLPHLICGSYKLYMSNGSKFPRKDIEPVYMNSGFDKKGYSSYLTGTSRSNVIGNHEGGKIMKSSYRADGEENTFRFHICRGEALFQWSQAYNKCSAWDRLTESQQIVLTKIAERVHEDSENGLPCTCIIIEGPGGCGKTRVLSHIMNHRSMNTLALYVTKQNNRVQEFIHLDCLKGEEGTDVTKPIDLSSKQDQEIKEIIQSNIVGGFAMTTNKLAYALARLEPRRFNPGTNIESLGINYDIFYRRQEIVGQGAKNESFNFENNSKRLIVIVVDEYGQHEPPLLHAILYYVKQYSRCRVVIIMGGDAQQCGPIGWDKQLHGSYTNDIPKEFATKIKYDPLVLTMENLERCKGDPALAACIKRLRRLSKEASDAQRSRNKVMGLVLARYSIDSGVDLYRHGIFKPQNTSVLLKVVPINMDRLDFDGSGEVAQTSVVSSVSDEEYDENGVEYIEQPIIPQYDLLTLVNTFTELYITLAVEVYKNVGPSPNTLEALIPHIGNIVFNWLQDVFHVVFPLFIVVSNERCIHLTDTALLGIFVQLQERLLSAPIHESLIETCVDQDIWMRHMKHMIRRQVRYVQIDDDDVTRRQTLLVGMLYRMTCTTKDDEGNSLCNGEKVVLTSILYKDNTLRLIDGVVVRKVNRNVCIDYTLRPGLNQNRLTRGQLRWVFPIVPIISDTIYQMQGTTMSVNSSSYIDLVNANCTNAYVAVSRFQNSESIKGIIFSD